MQIGGATIIAGVIGWPIKHSLSPRLHNYWFQKFNRDGVYIPLPVPEGMLSRVLEALPYMGFRGVNVTVPHKRAAFRHVQRHDEAAARMAAVNTILVHGDGSLEGRNTDGWGFIRNLDTQAPQWRRLRQRPVVLIGAGGACRAIAFTLVDQGVRELRIVNRTQARARELAQDIARTSAYEPLAIGWPERHTALEDAGLLVNGTSLGMRGAPPLDLTLDALPGEAVVVDIVYQPLETDLLRQAAARGHPTVDGLGMLLQQAVPGFSWWGGVTPVIDEEARRTMVEGLPL